MYIFVAHAAGNFFLNFNHVFLVLVFKSFASFVILKYFMIWKYLNRLFS